MTTPNQAAREDHDAELEKMEQDILKGTPTPEGTETPVTETPTGEEETPAPTSAPGEENQPPVVTPSPAAEPTGKEGEDDEYLTDEEVQKLSGKAQKRFKRLSEENIRIARENEFLRKHTKTTDQPTPDPVTEPRFKLPWESGEGDEPEPEDTAVVARREAMLVVAEEKRQEAILTNLQNDSKELETLYPEFDPANKEVYDPTLVTKISVWYKGLFKDNNDLRLKDFVTELMALREQGKAAGKSEVTETVIRQAADQAVTPTAPTGPASDTVVKKIQGARTVAELDALEAQI